MYVIAVDLWAGRLEHQHPRCVKLATKRCTVRDTAEKLSIMVRDSRVDLM